MPWLFRETTPERDYRLRREGLLRHNRPPQGHELHIARYRMDRQRAETRQFVEDAIAQAEQREDAEREARRRAQAEREEAAVRAAMDGVGPPDEPLPGYQNPSDSYRQQSTIQRAHEEYAAQLQGYSQNSSRHHSSLEERKEENLYRPVANSQASYAPQTSQQRAFQSSNPYQQTQPAPQQGISRPPSYRSDWGCEPPPGISRPPTYNTSEREHSNQPWWRLP
jgi:hypothetical protein